MAIGLGLYWVAMAFSIVIDVQSRVVDSTYILRVEFDSAHQHRLRGRSFALMHSVRQASALHNVYSKRGDGRDVIGSKHTTKARRFSVDTGRIEISHSSRFRPTRE